jgi:hypothetical protein
MTIAFRPEQEQLIGQAIKAGLIDHAEDVVEIGLEALRGRLQARIDASSSLPADEWMRKFRAWAHSLPTTTPLLSDEAISRESIYGDRGL